METLIGLNRLEAEWDDDVQNAVLEWLNVGTVKRIAPGEFMYNPKMGANGGDINWEDIDDELANDFFAWCERRWRDDRR